MTGLEESIVVGYYALMREPKVLGKDFFARDGTRVAEELLGMHLCVRRGGNTERYVITETESYHGHEDKASHASRGKTDRNAVMFGRAGVWYVYFIYGMYDMLNIVTGKSGEPSAVLVRGVEGLDGPGKLTKRLGITRALNGKSAGMASGVWIEARGAGTAPRAIARTPRIGVAYAGEWAEKPLRFVFEKPCVLVVSAHPDDEILSAGPLALRFVREGASVLNAAVTLGKKNQRARRLEELSGACTHIGSELHNFGGCEEDLDAFMSNVRVKEKYVRRMLQAIERHRPGVIVTHHELDGHPHHEAVNELVQRAIAKARWSGLLITTEYWHPHRNPNLLLEVSEKDLKHLRKAMSFHAGELERNPGYGDLGSFLRHNVRRAEVALGWGAEPPPFKCAILCRYVKYKNGRLVSKSHEPLILKAGDSLIKTMRVC